MSFGIFFTSRLFGHITEGLYKKEPLTHEQESIFIRDPDNTQEGSNYKRRLYSLIIDMYYTKFIDAYKLEYAHEELAKYLKISTGGDAMPIDRFERVIASINMEFRCSKWTYVNSNEEFVLFCPLDGMDLYKV